MIQVSVIVATYNSAPDKLRCTLNAICSQEDISLEVIVTDDGSAQKDLGWLPDYFKEKGVRDHQIIEHPENLGTLANLLYAIRAAKGEYVFSTSPGDLLFDSTVLRDFYRFAREHDAGLCFGNAVFYTVDAQGPRRSRDFCVPASPDAYAPGARLADVKLQFFCGNWVIGASYFRSRELAIELFSQIADVSKYMEDTPSTAFALADGHRLYYYDRNMLWYEDGTGVSTGASEKWKVLLNRDLSGGLTRLKQRCPRDPYVDIAYRNATQTSRWKRILGKLLCHPVLMMRYALQKKRAPKPIVSTDADLQRLAEHLQNR